MHILHTSITFISPVDAAAVAAAIEILRTQLALIYHHHHRVRDVFIAVVAAVLL